jgi:hypothetical protein
MRARIAVLACVVLCGPAVAEPKYAVDGLVLGTQLNFQSASYGEYGCSPSDQFDGLTWCQKTPKIKSDTTTYSLLHSREGTIFYINRVQELACRATIWMRTANGDRNVKGRPVAAL